MQLIASLVGSLAWPTAVVAAAWILRASIGRWVDAVLSGRGLSRMKAGPSGVELEFEQRAEAIEDQAIESLNARSSPVDPPVGMPAAPAATPAMSISENAAGGSEPRPPSPPSPGSIAFGRTMWSSEWQPGVPIEQQVQDEFEQVRQLLVSVTSQFFARHPWHPTWDRRLPVRRPDDDLSYMAQVAQREGLVDGELAESISGLHRLYRTALTTTGHPVNAARFLRTARLVKAVLQAILQLRSATILAKNDGYEPGIGPPPPTANPEVGENEADTSRPLR